MAMRASCLGLLLISTHVLAGWMPDGVTVDYGESIFLKSEFTSGRIAARWNWDKDFIESPHVKLTGYTELGYSDWSSDFPWNRVTSPRGVDALWQVGLSPVMRLETRQSWWGFTPFWDLGGGISYQSETELKDTAHPPTTSSTHTTDPNIRSLDMGGHVLFELRTTVGLRFKNVELAYGWFHYSNANIYDMNDGMDFQKISLHLFW